MDEKILEILTAIQADMQGMKSDMQEMKSEIKDLRSQVNCIDNRLADVDNRTRNIELTLENVVAKEIKIIAEGHLDISRNLENYRKDAEGLKIYRENFEIRLLELEKEVQKLKSERKMA